MLDITNKLIKGIKDYFTSTNGKTAVIGISGGKDSTVAAALCVHALGKENVIGILMPNGLDSLKDDSIEDGQRICNILGIKYHIINIHEAYNEIKFGVENALYNFNCNDINKAYMSKQAKINLAPRIRMSTLYAVAQSVEGGRVINTTNSCERYVGYGTLFGDTVGDFAVFKNVSVFQVYDIGDDLGLPHDLVHKTPSDGLTGKSDEEVLGVTYASINDYMKTDGIRESDQTGFSPGVRERIYELHKNSQFKRDMINLPGCDI